MAFRNDFELNWEMMRDIVSAPVIRCRQASIVTSNFILFSVRFRIFAQSTKFAIFLLRFLFFECENACEISNDYVHSSFYAQLNLANFTSDVIECGTHCIGREPSRASQFPYNFHIYSLSRHRFYVWAQRNSNKMNEFYGKTFGSQLSYYYHYISQSHE